MKKNFYLNLFSLVSMSALLLTSCADMYDKVQYSSTSVDNVLKVKAMIGDEVGTRGPSPLSSDTLTTANIKSFYMKAFYGAMTLIDTTTVGGVYTTGKFEKDGDVWKDKNANPYYWPQEDVKFLAFSSSEGVLPGADFLMSADSLRWRNFQVEDASGSSFKRQRDYVAAVATQNGSSGFSVSLHFQHLLSRLSINMWAPEVKFNNTKTLEVISFRFDNVSVKGTFKFTDGNTNSNFSPTCWSDTTHGNVGIAAGTSPENAALWGLLDSIPKASALQHSGYKLSDDTPWLNVIPGTKVSDSLTVYIKLTSKSDSVYYKSVGLSIPAGSVPRKDQSSSDDTYHPGYQYIYNLKVTGQDNEEGKVDSLKIELENVTVASWNNEHCSTPYTDEVGDNTLQALFKSAEAFAQINVQNDITIYGTDSKKDTVVVYKESVLNLNGYTLTLDSGTEKPAFTINSGVKFIIDNDTTSTSSHGHIGAIINSSSSQSLFRIASGGSLIIRGGTFDFDPTSPTCYIEGVSTDADFPKTYKADYFTDAYGNKKYRETKVTNSGANYLVEQTIKDYQE